MFCGVDGFGRLAVLLRFSWGWYNIGFVLGWYFVGSGGLVGFGVGYVVLVCGFGLLSVV